MLTSLNKLRELLNKRDKIIFCLLLIGMFIGAGLEVFSIGAIPALIGVAMYPEKIRQFEPAKAVLEFLGITSSQDILIFGSLALIFIFLIKNLYLCFQYYLQIRFSQNRQLRLTRRLFTAYMNAPYSFHLGRNSAELFRNTLQEVARIINKVLLSVLNLTMQSLMMAAIVLMLFVYNPIIALITTGILGIAGGGYQWLIKKKLRKYSQESQEHRKLIFKAIQQGLGVIKELKVLQREKYFIRALDFSLRQVVGADRFQLVTSKIASPYMEFISIAGLLSLVIVLFSIKGEIDSIIQTLSLFTVAFVRLKSNIGQIVTGIGNLRYGIVSINPVYQDLKLLEKNSKQKRGNIRNNHIERFHFSRKITLEDVWYKYPGSNDYAIKDSNLTIIKGHSVAFVGPTGSGKTTIIDVILGLLKPERGKITVDGQDIYDNVTAWYRNIGYIPQVIYLTDDTIRNNVALGLDDNDIDEEQVMQTIQAAHLESFIKTLPDGLETVVGERGIRLSGGQRQRIGIARALYHNPEVLIMDEATSSLDGITEKGVVESINRLKGDRTIIMIAHRLTTVQNCDTLYFMKNGRIECSGDYDELFNVNREFRAMAQAV